MNGSNPPRFGDEAERIRSIYEGRGGEADPFWSYDNWGQLIPEIQFGEGQFRDLLIEQLRESGVNTHNAGSLAAIELGCGWGRNLQLFVELGASPQKVVGVDLIQKFITYGKKQNPALNIAVGDATHTPFEDNSFDIVLLHTVLSAVFDRNVQTSLLDEASRLIKPGGQILIYDIDDRYPIGRTSFAGREVTFIRPVGRRNLLELAHRANLTVRRWQRCGLMPRLRRRVFGGGRRFESSSLNRAKSVRLAFSVRRALGTFLSLLPGCSSHYFVTLVQRGGR